MAEFQLQERLVSEYARCVKNAVLEASLGFKKYKKFNEPG
jgi:hypothetical protein